MFAKILNQQTQKTEEEQLVANDMAMIAREAETDEIEMREIKEAEIAYYASRDNRILKNK